LWLADANLLVTACLAAEQRYCRALYAAGPGQKLQQVIIGLAIDGRGGNADFEPAIGLYGDDFIATGAGLQTDVQNQIIILPDPGRDCHW